MFDLWNPLASENQNYHRKLVCVTCFCHFAALLTSSFAASNKWSAMRDTLIDFLSQLNRLHCTTLLSCSPPLHPFRTVLIIHGLLGIFMKCFQGCWFTKLHIWWLSEFIHLHHVWCKTSSHSNYVLSSISSHSLVQGHKLSLTDSNCIMIMM
jgi:hypothetical protein